MTHNKDKGTSVGFSSDFILSGHEHLPQGITTNKVELTQKDLDDLQETYEENKLLDAKYSEKEMQEAITLLERAYRLNKDDMSFDMDVTEFITKYKKVI